MTASRTAAVVVVVVVACCGCARLVTIAPEQVPGRNDPDWIIEAPPAPLEPLELPPPLEG